MSDSIFNIHEDMPGSPRDYNIYEMDILIHGKSLKIIGFSQYDKSQVQNILKVENHVTDINHIASEIRRDGVEQFMEYYAKRFNADGYLLIPNAEELTNFIMFEGKGESE